MYTLRLVPGNPISDEYVQSIYQDYQGALWVGMFHNGLCKLESGADKFTQFYTRQFETYTPAVFSLVDSLHNNEKSIASILRVDDSEERTVEFSITQKTHILIVGMGEIMGDLDDYGWKQTGLRSGCS